jgi:uncharacterized protein YndB with AHSA1/START domain
MNGMKAAEHVEVRVTQRLNAPPDRVFAAWLDPKFAGRWLFATASRPMARVSIDARVGGFFRFAEDENGETPEYSGVYIEVTPPSRLVFTLAIDRQLKEASRVTVEIMPRRGGSEVSLMQERVPVDHARGTEGRWTGMLYGLGVTLEAGPQAIHLERSTPQSTLSKKRFHRTTIERGSRFNDEEIPTCDS